MVSLQPLDSLVVDVIIDNQTDSLSTRAANVSVEFANVLAAGAKELSGSSLCCAQLGFSVMLTGFAGTNRRKLLFDAGPEGMLWLRNCRNLGIRLDDVQEIAISHGHWDHMGGLLSALDEIAKGGRYVPCHVNPGMFVERSSRLSSGAVAPFEKVPSPRQMESHGAKVVSDHAERTLLENCFYLSGEIPRVTEFEKGRSDHLCRQSAEEEWQPDPLLMDERYLAAHVKDKGVVVFSSCSHAGIVNVLLDVKNKFADVPLYAVFGGLHLVGSLEKIIPQTVEELKKLAPKNIITAHCTGFRAQNALLNAFGEEVVDVSAVGAKYTF